MGETPLLRVSRPVSACSRCRSAKVRCDGKLPACTACERAGRSRECSSANDEFAKGKERSYVASLESKVQQLEKALAQRPVELDPEHPPSSQAPPRAPFQFRQQSDDLDVDDLVSDFGCLSVNATAGGCPGFMVDMSFARLVLATACHQDLHIDAPQPLPSRDICRSLARQCSDNVFAFYGGVLSETAVFGALESAHQRDGRFCRAMEMWIAHLVLAIAFMSRSHYQHDSYYRDGTSHAATALRYSEDVIQTGSVAGVQAVLLLVLYAMLDPSRLNCWYLIGVASRIMVDIGLHQGSFAKGRYGKQQSELRRRVFYSVYSLDRAISMSYRRAFSFSDDSIDVELPSSSETPASHSWVQGDHQQRPLQTGLMKLRQALSPQYIAARGSSKQVFDGACHKRARALEDLEATASKELDGKDDVARHILLCEFFFGRMLLVSPPGSPREHDHFETSLLFKCCTGFAQNIWLLCNRAGSLHFGTCLDMERALLVGDTLTEVLKSPSSRFMECEAIDTSEPRPLPGSLDTGMGDPRNASTRAMDAVTQLVQVLDILGSRFGKSARLDAFRRTCLETLRSLHSRRALEASGG